MGKTPSPKKVSSAVKTRRSSKPNPFGPLADYRSNACINNYMQFEELAEHYRESADALVKCTKENRSTLDVHVYAICFLYRHSFELVLKGLFWQSGYALNSDKTLRGGHGLQSLWAEVEERTRRLLDSDFPLSRKETAAVKQLFADIEEHDPGSDSFRYPIDSTKKRRTHPTLTHVNVRALCEAVTEATDHLGRIHHLVDYHYTQRSEMERENG